MRPHTSPAPEVATLASSRQDLLLNRAMLSVNKTPYVGRFARDWHRLSTTEPLAAQRPFYAGAPLGRGSDYQYHAEPKPQYQYRQRR
jgi:hypothetical protein